MTRPAWWTALHDRALAALTPEWQNAHGVCDDLHVKHGMSRATSFHALEDLVAAGEAEVRRDRIASPSGHPAGELTFFRATRGEV